MKGDRIGKGLIDLVRIIFMGHEELSNAEFTRGGPRRPDQRFDQRGEHLCALGDTFALGVGEPVLEFLMID